MKTIQKKRMRRESSTEVRVRTGIGEGTVLDQLHHMKESKYENFRPMRFPMERAIHRKNMAVV